MAADVLNLFFLVNLFLVWPAVEFCLIIVWTVSTQSMSIPPHTVFSWEWVYSHQFVCYGAEIRSPALLVDVCRRADSWKDSMCLSVYSLSCCFAKSLVFLRDSWRMDGFMYSVVCVCVCIKSARLCLHTLFLIKRHEGSRVCLQHLEEWRPVAIGAC